MFLLLRVGAVCVVFVCVVLLSLCSCCSYLVACDVPIFRFFFVVLLCLYGSDNGWVLLSCVPAFLMFWCVLLLLLCFVVAVLFLPVCLLLFSLRANAFVLIFCFLF